jgi:outer membrane protein TolC
MKGKGLAGLGVFFLVAAASVFASASGSAQEAEVPTAAVQATAAVLASITSPSVVAEALSLEDSVALALANSDDVKSARETLQSDYAQIAARNPLALSSLSGSAKTGVTASGDISVSGSFSYSIPITPQLSLGAAASLSSSQLASDAFSVGATFKPFAYDSQTEALLYAAREAELNLQSALVSAELETRQAYVALLDARDAEDLAADTLAVNKALYDKEIALQNAGKATATAVYEARSDMLSAQRSLTQAQKAEFSARIALENLMGASVGDKALSDTGNFDAANDPEAVALEKALSVSSAVRLAALKVEEAKVSLDRARSLSPDLSIGATVSIDGASSPSLSLSMSLGSTTLVNTSLSVLEASYSSALRALQTARAKVKSDLETAKRQFSLALAERERAQSARDELAAADEQASIQLENGAVLASDRELARVNLIGGENDLKSAKRSLWSAWWSLIAALKG